MPKSVSEGTRASFLAAGQALQSGQARKSLLSLAPVSTDGSDAPEVVHLTACGRNSYCMLKGVACMYDFLIRPAQKTIYRDVLGMRIATMAMVISSCKSFDFLWGFAVGYLSDHTNTRWGRRKPWILVCGLIWVICIVALGSPPASLGVQQPNNPIACKAGSFDNQTLAEGGCPTLQSCVASAIQDKGIPPYTSPTEAFSGHGRSEFAGNALTVYFAVFYLGFFLAGWTGTMIPYDALAMELTEEASERAWLFGFKTLFQFSGNLVQIIIGIVLSTMFVGDIPKQVSSQALPYAGLGLLAILAIFCNVKERPLEVKSTQSVPVVPSVLALFQNKPYMVYLAMKVPLTLACLLPVSLVLDYIKYSMQIEDFQSLYLSMMALVLLSCIAWVPVLAHLSTKIGKGPLMTRLCFLSSFIMLSFFCIPPITVTPMILYCLCPFLALGSVGAYVVPDAILNDIIDYAELRTGERAEGIYCIVETNLQQFVEIIGGVLPMMIMGWCGFLNNGGCDCGCGAPCPAEFLRWNCPGDIGYACGGKPTSALLYGIADRVAPCTKQPEAVAFVIRFFVGGLSGTMYLFAAIASSRLPITEEVHSQIRNSIKLRRSWASGSSQTSIDPVTQQDLPKKLGEYDSFDALHFTAAERKLAGETGLGSVVKKIGAQLGISVILLVGIFVLIIAAPFEGQGDRHSNMVTMSCLVLSVLFVLIPWDCMRLVKARQCSDPLEPSDGPKPIRGQSSWQGDTASQPWTEMAASPSMESK